MGSPDRPTGQDWHEGPGYRITCLRMPMRRGPLGEARAYLVSAGAEHLLVDTGSGDEQAAAALDAQLQAAGVQPTQIGLVVLTHLHPDHAGSTERLQAAGVHVVCHRVEAEVHARRVADPAAYGATMAAWLAACGVPSAEGHEWAASLATRFERRRFIPDGCLSDGDVVPIGDLRFDVTWTPGHTPGHIVLTERRRRLVLVGDHVLPSVAPNVGADPDGCADPLPAYLASLRRMARLRGTTGLPGHGDAFELAPRARSLGAHQLERARLIREAIDDDGTDAYAVARRIWPAATWTGFSDYLKTNALRTVVAHLARLEARGEASRALGQPIHYRRTATARQQPPAGSPQQVGT